MGIQRWSLKSAVDGEFVESEIIDLRFVNPLDYEVLTESVKKTGRIILASDAVEYAR